MATAPIQFNAHRPELPAIFRRAGFDVEFIDRRPDAAEALHSAGFFDALERAVLLFEREVEKAEAIQADSDLTPEGRQRRIEPLLTAAQRDAFGAVDSEVAKVRGAMQRAQADVDGSSRPPSPTSVEAVAFELRVIDCRRQLEALSFGEAAGIILSAAQAGDSIPLLAAERSYRELVPAELTAEARKALGLALNQPAALAVKLGGERLEIAERYSAVVKAQVAQRMRLFSVPAVAA